MHLLSYAAAVTNRMKLGTPVMLNVLRNPVPLANSLASLDQLLGTRLVLSVGLGGYADIYPASVWPRVSQRRYVHLGSHVLAAYSLKGRAGLGVAARGGHRTPVPSFR